MNSIAIGQVAPHGEASMMPVVSEGTVRPSVVGSVAQVVQVLHGKEVEDGVEAKAITMVHVGDLLSIPKHVLSLVGEVQGLIESKTKDYVEGVRDALLGVATYILALCGDVVKVLRTLMIAFKNPNADSDVHVYMKAIFNATSTICHQVQTLFNIIECHRTLSEIKEHSDNTKELDGLHDILLMVSDNTKYWGKKRGLGSVARETSKQLLPKLQIKDSVVKKARTFVTTMKKNVSMMQKLYIVSFLVNFVGLASIGMLVVGTACALPVVLTLGGALGFITILNGPIIAMCKMFFVNDGNFNKC